MLLGGIVLIETTVRYRVAAGARTHTQSHLPALRSHSHVRFLVEEFRTVVSFQPCGQIHFNLQSVFVSIAPSSLVDKGSHQ